MKICFNGRTRIVILTRCYAIKFARFHGLRPFIRLLEIIVRRESVAGNLTKHSEAGKLWEGMFRYLFFGIAANLDEYHLYRQYGGTGFLAPTIVTLGFVNIQSRCCRAQPDDVVLFTLWRDLVNDGKGLMAEAIRPDQLGWYKGKLVLIDYAIEGLEPYLLAKMI